LNVPPALTQLIAYTMAKNVAVRHQKASAVAEQLAPFVGTAQENYRPAAAPATTAEFEQWLQTKSAPASVAPEGIIPADAMAPVSVAAPAPVSARVEPARAVPRNPAPAATRESAPAISVATPSVLSPGAGSVAVSQSSGAAPTVTVSPGVRTAVATSANAAELVRRRARARRRNNLIILGTSIASVLGVLVAVVVAMSGSGSESDGAKRDPPVRPADKAGAVPAVPSSGSTAGSVAGEASESATQGLPDDGRMLWASPTSGPPISLRYVPSGAQLYLVVRPAELLDSDEGQRVVRALGPSFESARATWESSVGVNLGEIEQLIVALYGNSGEFPRSVCVVRLSAERSPNDWLASWGRPPAVPGLDGMYMKGERAFYIPADDPHTMVTGPLEPELKDAASARWQPPVLRREVGQLLSVSDSSRHVTLLFVPNFLFGDGRGLFAGPRAAALEPVEWLLGDGLKAVLASMHMGDHAYFELRMESDIQTDRYQLAAKLRERMAQIPDAIELHFAQLNPPPYWRLVANRYPNMIRYLHDNTRVGIEGNHAAVNAVLPGMAAHNLVFGGEMMLASAAGLGPAVSTVPAVSNVPVSIQDVLKSRISIAFAQDSLEFAVQNVANEVKSTFPALPFEFKIKILGPDLEKDGITRNQQIREFEQKDTSVADVLTAMVRKANPITTVKDPSELDQKLVWVIGPDPESAANSIVLVTTRTGAEQKKLALPDPFRRK
jgi:hypothetical protein